MLLDDTSPSDPCVAPPTFSWDRFFLFVPVFLAMMPGSAVLFILLGDRPLGIQFASLVGYSAAVVLYTFSANRGMQRFLFHCPVVRGQLSRLALRHLGFLVVLCVVQTVALQLSPRLPAWWFVASGKKSMPPFTLTLFIFGIGLALAEILTSRSLLTRAHLEQ